MKPSASPDGAFECNQGSHGEDKRFQGVKKARTSRDQALLFDLRCVAVSPEHVRTEQSDAFLF